MSDMGQDSFVLKRASSMGKRRSSLSFCAEVPSATLSEGREGNDTGKVAGNLRDRKELTEDKIELIYEAFQMFPLDAAGKITPIALSNYYRNVGLIYSTEQCVEMISLFLGESSNSISFEDFALGFIRCEKSLPANPILKIALTELNIEDESNAFSRDLFLGALNINNAEEVQAAKHLVSALKNL